MSLVLFLPPCPLLHLSFYLKLSGRSGRNCLLSPVLSGYNGSPDTHFSQGTTRLMSWPDALAPSAIPCSLFLLSLVFALVFFSDWRRIVSLKFFDTQVSSISTEELMLPCHARCVLSRPRCNGHSLLLSSYLSRIGRIESSSCSACGHSSQDTSLLILYCPVTDFTPLGLWRLSVSLRPLVQTLGSCPAFGAPWSSPMPPSLGWGRVTTTTAKTMQLYSQPRLLLVRR